MITILGFKLISNEVAYSIIFFVLNFNSPQHDRVGTRVIDERVEIKKHTYYAAFKRKQTIYAEGQNRL